MEEILNAVVFFWLPLSIIALGAWISLSSKDRLRKNAGKFLSLLGFILVCVSPWTVPSSPSSAIGHLLGFIIGPSALLMLGIYLIIFSGNVPVGRLPSSDRKMGLLSVFISFIWFILMQWADFTPMYDGSEVNNFWLIFFPTFLVMLCSMSALLSVSMLAIGNQRQKESRIMIFISLISMLIIICGMNFDGQNISAETFREYFWLSVADLFGILIGISMSILVFGLVIYIYESSISEPESVPKPSKNELILASEKIAQNIGGDESE
tara:strand:+ start:2064 stop:2861 length:798 start_codon:yes stop_codon:yes gene_type:complete